MLCGAQGSPYAAHQRMLLSPSVPRMATLGECYFEFCRFSETSYYFFYFSFLFWEVGEGAAITKNARAGLRTQVSCDRHTLLYIAIYY